MITTSCPDRIRLRDCLQGRLAEDDSGSVFEHLQMCPRCETLARELESSGDDLMNHLRAAGRCGVEDSRPSWLSRVQSAVPDADDNGWRQPDAIVDEVPSMLGAYELQGVIGCGGMGVVYRAVHQRLGKPVAVKLMAARAAPAAAARFEREMRAVGRLDHPAIVRATDAGSVEGRLFLAMELIDGVDLRRLLHHCSRLPVADACEIVRQAAIGLQAAHQAGVVHRDMKPSNLMLNRDGLVKILDFGLAATEAADGGITHATSVGQVLGTLDYLAPEQVDGEAVDGRADVYALGATLFTLLAGRPPLGGEPGMPLLRRLRRLALEDPPRLSELRPDVPEPLDALVAQMLARDPAARVGSAAEVAQRLDPLAAGHDLAGLAQRALCAASSDSAALSDIGLAPHTGLVSPARDDRRQHAAGQATARPVGTPWSGRLTRVLLALALLGGGIWWGIVILLETPQGTLRIESEVGQVRIELLDAQDRVQELQIDRGENETTLRAGQYRLRLAGEHDAVAISPSTITLRKGEQQVARITRLDAAPADPAVADVPTRSERLYQGTPESVWQRQLEAELSPLSQLEAAQALVVLAGELPPERWIDRILEIGGILVEAGWGEQAYRLPLDNIRSEHTDDVVPIQNAPAWTGAIARMNGSKPLAQAWTGFRELIVEQQQRLAVPPMLLAQRLGHAVTAGKVPVSAFAASLMLDPCISGSILRDPDALRYLSRSRWLSMATCDSVTRDPVGARSFVLRLRHPVEGFEWQAISTLVAAWLYEGATYQDRRNMATRMNELAERLLQDSTGRLHAEITDAWLVVARRIYHVSEGSAPSSATVDVGLAAELVYKECLKTPSLAMSRWFRLQEVGFSSKNAYRAGGPRDLRQKSGFFLRGWISLVNRHLADDQTDDVHYEVLLASLDKVLRARMPDDAWDVDTTARLLTERLQQYWSGEKELPSMSKAGSLLTPHGFLRNIVRIRGTLPDFVRSAPPWIQAWDQVLSPETWEELKQMVRELRGPEMRDYGRHFFYTTNELEPLARIAPFHAVQLAVGPKTVLLHPYFTMELLWGPISPGDSEIWLDPLLLFAILADLSGQDQDTDRQIALLVSLEPVSFNVHEIFAGNTALRPIAQDLLTRIAQQALDPRLRDAIRKIEEEANRQPESQGE